MGQTFDIHDYLIERCKSGDSVAQQEIYNRYAKNMYNTSYRILGHQAEAEDVLQESFLEVFTKINEYRGESTFGAWLKRIVINRSISLLRKRKFELIDDHDVDNIAEEEFQFDFQDSASKIIEAIKSEVNKLSDGYRLVLSLYLFEGYDHVEIAQILKISESTSKTQYARGKEKLRQQLLMLNLNE